MAYQSVLMIDDDNEDREIFQSALHELHPSVSFTSMGDARRALHALIEGSIKPEVIFLDLNMPEMNGLEFLTEVKKNELTAPIDIIVFSTSSHVPTIELTKRLGAKDFITKPGRYGELLDVLRRHI